MILYDCYDENEDYIGIIFAENCEDLLNKNPNVFCVRGMEAVTRKPQWFRVFKSGLSPYTPQKESYKEELKWLYSDFY